MNIRVLWLGVLLPALAGAQPSWQASAPTETRLELFSAIRTANYPPRKRCPKAISTTRSRIAFCRPLTRGTRPISDLMGRPISAPRLVTASATD